MVDAAHTGRLRIVFFGTPAFAVPTLDALLHGRHDVVGVVTQPDRPRGRGFEVTSAPVKAHAVAAGVRVLQPERMTAPGFLDDLSALNADLAVVAAYGKILSDKVLSVAPLGFINVHASLLPRYRGAAPVHRAIVDGERETGVTIMRVVKALDAGPLLARAPRPIGANDTSEEVERDLALLGAGLLVDTIDALAAGRVHEAPQDQAAANYAPRLTKDEGLIDWTWPAQRIHDLIRGLRPWPHAFTWLAGRRFMVLRSTWSSDAAAAAPGTILEAAGDRFRIATGAGVVNVVEIQAESKRPVTAREFLAGHRISQGDTFTPRL